jgi:predicted ATPase/transcriptional regulator with XRE-family HTH domain
MLLRRYRLAAGLSQEALAERARMSTNGIGALERGYRRTPQHETVALLAGALALDEGQREDFEAAAARSALPRRLGPASVTIGPWTDTTNSNLPLALKSYVGRETEIDEIVTLVHDHRLVTLVGVGGLGKTETALHVGRSLKDASDTAVCLVSLAPVSDPALVVTAIASALGVQEVPNRPLLAALVAYLKNKPLLLILDNCEHVIEQAAEVAETTLNSCANVRILATSRESLRAVGERSYRLPSLRVPSPKEASSIRASDAVAYEAIALFADRARGVDHRFALTDENAAVVAEICRRLDGIPLAIELAAARINRLSPKALAEKLENRFQILIGGERTALARQQTMRATIDWSYDLLSAPEQRVFERLSVFAGGCVLAAATAVCGDEGIGEDDVFDLLSSLVDKSLVVVDSEGGEIRYRLLESFRQYAREKLGARGEHELIAHRHAYAYLRFAEQLDRVFFYEPDEVLQAQSREELDNWRAALQWSLSQRSDVLLGQRLVGELNPIWQNFAAVEGRRWLTRARRLADPQTPTGVLARLDYTEVTLANALVEEYELQLASSRSAAARYRVVGDSLGIALAEAREFVALHLLSRYAEAKLLLQELLPLARSVGNQWLYAFVLRHCGEVSRYDGNLAASRAYAREALQRYEALGSKRDVAFTMLQLSGIELYAGNAELALRLATDALATFRRINLARGVAGALNVMGDSLISLDRYGEAETTAREQLYLARELHLRTIAAEALQHLAAAAALQAQGPAECRAVAYIRAARTLGYCDARCAALETRRDKSTQQEYDRVLALLRDALGADAVAKLMAEGTALTEEQAVEETLS